MVEDKILELCKNILGSDGYVACFEVSCSDCPLRKGNYCYGTTATRKEGRIMAQQYINDHTKTKEFDWKAFRENKISVRCDTEEKAKDFIKKAYLNGCYWIKGDSESTRWKSNCTKIIYDCCDGNGRLFWGDTYYSKKHNKPIIKWEIKEEVKIEKSLLEIIQKNKNGVWENDDRIITMEDGVLAVTLTKRYACKTFVLGLDEVYTLQRKQYTFTEAFKAYEEGKEIESCKSGNKYKICIKYNINYPNGYKVNNKFSTEEIRNKWYINN